MKICKKCCGCGFKVGYGGFSNPAIKQECPKCEGAGWVNKDGTPYKLEPEPTTGTITILGY